jgi:hypothetical protein
MSPEKAVARRVPGIRLNAVENGDTELSAIRSQGWLLAAEVEFCLS